MMLLIVPAKIIFTRVRFVAHITCMHMRPNYQYDDVDGASKDRFDQCKFCRTHHMNMRPDYQYDDVDCADEDHFDQCKFCRTHHMKMFAFLPNEPLFHDVS